MTQRQNGFTLIELAIVLVVIGVLAGALFSSLSPIIENSHTATTNKRMERIELALLAYVIQNGCLPCPADGNLATTSTNAGWSHSTAAYYGPNGPTNQPCAAPTGSGCAALGGSGAGIANAIGVVPWRTLGLGEGEIVDAWNDRISYAVTSALCVTVGSSMVRTLPADYPVGTLTVSNNSGATQTSAAAYVLISHGRDRTFAYQASSGNNVTNSGGYVAANPQGVNSPTLGTGTSFRQDDPLLIRGSTYFDDIVQYRTAPSIILDCGPNNCGNPAL